MSSAIYSLRSSPQSGQKELAHPHDLHGTGEAAAPIGVDGFQPIVDAFSPSEGDRVLPGVFAAELEAIIEQIIPGRWEDVRPPNELEMNTTGVVLMEIDETTAKVRAKTRQGTTRKIIA